MSNWTHVAGIVRIDSIRLFDRETTMEARFREYFGKQLDFYDSDEKWQDARNNPQDYLPMGSEGSLKMSVWVNPREDDLAAYTVSIFGDLRDHDDSFSIVEWFKEKCNGVWVRDAVIVVRNEINGTVTWPYMGEEE